MFSSGGPTVRAGILVAVFTSAACRQGTREPAGIAIEPARMARVGTVDERFQSYNVEMLEVTGGKFWKPYGPELDTLLKQPAPAASRSSEDTPAGMNPGLYQYRPPLDLTQDRLRKLAAALGPA
jgi:heparanase